MEKLFISPSPHIHSGDSIQKNMYAVVVALMPAVAVALYTFGIGALITIALSVISCVLIEYIIAKFLMKQEPSIADGSAVLTGLLLGMNLPSNIAPWIVILGALLAIAVAKMSFGGLGANIFNPALVGRVFLLIAYPAQMATFPLTSQYTEYLDAKTGATALGAMKAIIKSTPGDHQLPTYIDSLLGFNLSGSLGEVSAIALLIGLAFLLYRKVITWHIPVSVILSTLIFGHIMHFVNPAIYPDGLFHILNGGLMLGAIFMATDYVTSPMSKKGQLIFGAMIGIITILIRLFGAYPEGVSFAILIMNAFTPLINTYVKPTHFGGK